MQTMDLHGFADGSQPSSPAESLGEEIDLPQLAELPKGEPELASKGGENERPASQQMDFTYFLWSTIQNDLNTGNEASAGQQNSSSENKEIEGSKLWSVWNSTNDQGNPPNQPNVATQSKQTEQHSNWNDHNQPGKAKMGHPTAPMQDPAIARFLPASESPSLAQQQANASRGMNPNDLFAKFQLPNGGGTGNGHGNAHAQPPAPQSVPPPSKSSPTPGQPMSLEDLERRMMMKKKGQDKPDMDKHGHQQQQRSFFDSQFQQQPQHGSKDEQPVPPLNAIQMQLAAAQQAMMNAANAAGGAPSPQQAALIQQQKMLIASIVQQHQMAGQSGGNQGGQPGLPALPPNALAMAAAAAMAAAQSAQSPMMYYPQLLQQAQSQGNRPGSNATGPNASNAQRPPFQMPPPGSFPNIPGMNPSAAASLMAALNNMQQQKPSSPGPAGQQIPNAMAAAAALMSRMGINPPNVQGQHQQQHQQQQQQQHQYQHQHGFAHHGNQPNNGPSSQTQHQHSTQQHHSGVNSPNRVRAQSPAVSSSKVNASFIPTQVMMKNPHTASSESSTGSVLKSTAQMGRPITSSNKQQKQSQPDRSNNGGISYSSVASHSGPSDAEHRRQGGFPFQQQNPTKQWNAEDLEKNYMKNRDGPNNYSSYPPLHGGQQQSNQNSQQRTAGIAALSLGQARGSQETAHQFSVADLLRGAASASTSATAQPSSTSFS